MVLSLDDLLRTIAKGGGAGAPIARSALQPTRVGNTGRFLSPSYGGGPFAHLAGTLTPKAPEATDSGPGGWFGAVLKGLDLGRGMAVSTIKEGIDLAQDVVGGRVGQGEFSPSEWWNQATSHYGFGDLIDDEREWVGAGLIALSPFTAGASAALGLGVLKDNIWADRVIGFVGDVALDPLMYMGGAGAFARGLGWSKVARSLGDFAARSADDLVRTGVTKSLKSAEKMRDLANGAALAAEKSQSLTGASRYLLKSKDPLARELSNLMGLTPGLRLRLPGSHGVGRLMRQDRYIDWAMKQLPERIGLAEGVAGRQLKNVPKFYRDVFGDDELLKGIKAFRLGGAKGRAAVNTLRRETAKNSEMLLRVAGQAARSPLEIALPGLRLGGGAARAGLGAGVISRVADLPIRAALKATPEGVQQKLAAHFQPNAVLRTMRKSGNPRLLQLALGEDDFMRHARAMEHVFGTSVSEAQDTVIKRSAGYKVADASLTDLGEAISKVTARDAEGTIIGLSRGEARSVQRKWWDNLPDEIKRLDPEAQRILARDIDEWQQVTGRHIEDVWEGTTAAMKQATGMEDYMPGRIREDNLPHIFKREDYSQIDEFSPTPGGTQKPWPLEAHGRVTPTSLQHRRWLPGSKVVVENPSGVTAGNPGGTAHVADGVKPNQIGKNQKTGKPIIANVLHDPDTGLVFVVKNPDAVGMSIRRQINIAHEKVYGRPLYENDFSVLAEKWKVGMGRDIRMEHFNRRTSDIFPMFNVEKMTSEVRRVLKQYEEIDTARLGLSRKQRKTLDRIERKERAVATHVKTQEREAQTAARLTAEAQAIDGEMGKMQGVLEDLYAETRVLEEELSEYGLDLASLKPAAEQARKLESGRFGERAKNTILKAEAVSARVAQIEEEVLILERTRDAFHAIVRQETDRWLGNVTMDAEGVRAANAAYSNAVAVRDAAQADYDRLVARIAHLERRFPVRQAELEAHAERVERLIVEADRLQGLEEIGRARRAEIYGRPEVAGTKEDVAMATKALEGGEERVALRAGELEVAEKQLRVLASKGRRRGVKDEAAARATLKVFTDAEMVAERAVETAQGNLTAVFNAVEGGPVAELDVGQTAAQKAYDKARTAARKTATAAQLSERPRGVHHLTWKRLRKEQFGAETWLAHARKQLAAHKDRVRRRIKKLSKSGASSHRAREAVYTRRRESLRRQIQEQRDEIAKQEARGPFKTQGPETGRRNKIVEAQRRMGELQRELDEAYKVGTGGETEKLEETIRLRQADLDRVEGEMQALRGEPPPERAIEPMLQAEFPRGRPERTLSKSDQLVLNKMRAALKKAKEAWAATQTKKVLAQRDRAQELVDAYDEVNRLYVVRTRRDALGKKYEEPSGTLQDAIDSVERLKKNLKSQQIRFGNVLRNSQRRGAEIVVVGVTDPRLPGRGRLFAVDRWKNPQRGLAEFVIRPEGSKSPYSEEGRDAMMEWRALMAAEGLPPEPVSERVLLRVERTSKRDEWTLVAPRRDLDVERIVADVGSPEGVALRDELREKGWRFYDEPAPAEEAVALHVGDSLHPNDPLMVELTEAKRLVDDVEADIRAVESERSTAKARLEEMEAAVQWEEHGPVLTDHYGRQTGERGKKYRERRPLVSDEERFALSEAEMAVLDTEVPLAELRAEARAARVVAEDLSVEVSRLAQMSPAQRTQEARRAAEFAVERQRVRQALQDIRAERLRGAKDDRQPRLFAPSEGAELPVRPPEDLGGVYTAADDLNEAFSEGLVNLKNQLGFLTTQVKLIAASGVKLAEQDVTVQAMRALLRVLRSGVGGTKALTPHGRMNRWIEVFKNFEELDAALQHEAFSAGARVERVANSRQGIAGFNAAYARETAGLEGLQTQAVRVGDTPVAGRQLKGGKWTKIVDEGPKQGKNQWHRHRVAPAVRGVVSPEGWANVTDADILVRRGSRPGRVEIEWNVPDYWKAGFPGLGAEDPGPRSLASNTRSLRIIFDELKRVTDEMLAEGLVVEAMVDVDNAGLLRAYKRGGFKELPGAHGDTWSGERISLIKEPPGVSSDTGLWTPFKLSADELAEKQARLEWMGQQKAEYDALIARRPQLDEEIAAAGKKGDEAAVHQLGREKDIYELEVQHMERVLNEWEPLLLREDVAHQRVKTVEEGLVDTLASMERRTRLVRGDDASVGGYSPEGAGGRTFQDVVMGMIERGGSGVDEGTGETLFALKAKDREAAQELLKDAFGSSEWGPWRLLSGDEALDRDMLDIINAFARINDPAQFGGNGQFWKTWDKVQNYLKSAMIATPGFVNRNIFGAFFNAWLDGVNLNEIVRSAKMTHEVANYARSRQVSVLRAAKALEAGDPNRWKNYVELLEVGVRGGGQAVNAVELQIGLRQARNLEFLIGQRDKTGRLVPGGKQYNVSWKAWSPRFAPYQAVRSVNSWVEDVVRLGVGMDTMRWGGTVDDAIARIAKTQFDYDELTGFERKWMRRFFPFYTWTRKNVPYQLKQLGAHPEKYNRLLSAKRNLELGTEEEGVVPDYFLHPFGVRLPFGLRGATVYSAPDIPFQDLFRYDPFQQKEGQGWKYGIKQTAQNLLSMSSPVVKAPLETAFGRQVFSGIPFTGRYGVAPNSVGKIPGLSQALEGIGWIKRAPDGRKKMRDHHIYFITNLLPTLGLLRRLWPNEPKYQRNYVRSLISTLGGVSANFNTPEVQSNWLQSQRYDRLDKRKDHMDLISRLR